MTKDGFIGCIDLEGHIVVPCVFDLIGEFLNGKANATCCGINGEIDETGKGFDEKELLAVDKNPDIKKIEK